MDDIKNLIKKYIEKDDSIAEINKQIKDIRKEKGILEEMKERCFAKCIGTHIRGRRHRYITRDGLQIPQRHPFRGSQRNGPLANGPPAGGQPNCHRQQ